MDIRNLETASDYINNLLLSRGLLRNGEPISFAHPSQDEGGKQATITKVINLVHDLILRRDRESEITAKLSQDVVNLRNTSAQQIQTIQKLESRKSEAERQLALKCASEKTATTNLGTVEARAKVLKDDMARLKATVGQIRAQCANDVRKKETELKRLQKYLEPKRGREGSVQVGLMVVNPGSTLQGSSNSYAATQQAQTSLFRETADHLTQLSRQLSEENQALRALVYSTVSTLRDLQGIPDSDAIEAKFNEDMISRFNAEPYTNLEVSTREALDQLRSLLTNPSFVSLEEVQIREEEIVRLREGWEKMESRWREALSLMHGWRKRMMETGDAINLDDIRRGLVLGSTPITMPPTSVRKGRVSVGQLPSPDDSLIEEHNPTTLSNLQTEEMMTTLNGLEDDDLPEEAEETPISLARPSDQRGVFPAPRILRPTNGNILGLPAPMQLVATKRQSSDADTYQENLHKSPAKRPRNSEANPSPELDEFLDDYDNDNELADELENQSLTIEEKLSLAKQEAEAAAVALRRTMAKSTTTMTKPHHSESKHDEAKAEKQPVKRAKAPLRLGGAAAGAGKRSKRRSTLLPEELEGLIGM